MSNEIVRRKGRQKAALKGAKQRTSDAPAVGHGGGSVAAWAPKWRGRRTMLLGTTPSQHGIGADPREHLASRIRHAMDPQRLPGTVTVFGADGKPVATINPLTRERTELA